MKSDQGVPGRPPDEDLRSNDDNDDDGEYSPQQVLYLRLRGCGGQIRYLANRVLCELDDSRIGSSLIYRYSIAMQIVSCDVGPLFFEARRNLIRYFMRGLLSRSI